MCDELNPTQTLNNAEGTGEVNPTIIVSKPDDSGDAALKNKTKEVQKTEDNPGDAVLKNKTKEFQTEDNPGDSGDAVLKNKTKEVQKTEDNPGDSRDAVLKDKTKEVQKTEDDPGDSRDAVLKNKTKEVQETEDNPGDSRDAVLKSSTKEVHFGEKKSASVRSFKVCLEKVQAFYKADLFVFMAYTTLSAFFGGVFGAMLTVYVPKYFSLNDSSVDVYAKPVTTSCPAGPPPVMPPPSLPKDFNASFKALQESLAQCQASQKHDKEILVNLTNNVTLMRDEVTRNHSFLSGNVTLKDFVVDSQMNEFGNLYLSKGWMFIILVMVLFDLAVMAGLWMMWLKVTAYLSNSPRGNYDENRYINNHVASGANTRVANDTIQGDMRVLRQVRKCALEKRVCVVGFHSGTMDNHTSHVKTILSLNDSTKTIPVEQFLIRSHDHILQIPTCKLYVVFVNFNERNVILEDPNKGLGDLRLTTVQAIDIMEGQIILVYSQDNGSKTLTSELYNKDLSSVRQHPELRKLDKRQCFFSVFDNFTKVQEKHLQKVAENVLRL